MELEAVFVVVVLVYSASYNSKSLMGTSIGALKLFETLLIVFNYAKYVQKRLSYPERAKIKNKQQQQKNSKWGKLNDVCAFTRYVKMV